jgi:ABC-type sugar transport system substrate-binding protein
MLIAAPDFNLIFAEDDSMGLGAIIAIMNAGIENEIKVVSIDGEMLLLKASGQ